MARNGPYELVKSDKPEAWEMESESYESPLLEVGQLERAQAEIRAQKARIEQLTRRLKSLVLVVFVAVILIVGLIVKYTLERGYDPTQQLYSPARSAVEYKVVKFHRDFGKDLPVYERPPSPEVDLAWKELYAQYTVSRITRQEAELAINKTQLLWKTHGYMASLDVFHQLHCLDQLRMALHPKDYPDLDLPPGHMRHCIGVIRQGTMCAADINLDVWQWSNKVQRVASRVDVLHTCRNFEKIQEWAKDPERIILPEEFENPDFKMHVDDDIVVAGYHP